MKVEIVQKTSIEIVSIEPLTVRISTGAKCGENGVDFAKTVTELEEFLQFTQNASAWLEQFAAEQVAIFIQNHIFGGENEKPTA
ncbi:Uncharacterised protein [Canicola haemoglobinophilus]|uniref:Uncharacterized protein n=1 Tax=Canicola haemoglobinophilus TaxID=733 RepID=A0AB38HAD9_9PAST|nr:hypothetical protein [Canicola haemoglobinophilus]STO55167.1 Uncharacterised protein [Canicola haemoglobinophilus]STO69262.1 Uncharacterised protein [Canicola haemoglobinophilus]